MHVDFLHADGCVHVLCIHYADMQAFMYLFLNVYDVYIYAFAMCIFSASIMQMYGFLCKYFACIWIYPFCRHLDVYIRLLHYMHSLCRFMVVYVSTLFCIYMNICIIYAHDKSHVIFMIQIRLCIHSAVIYGYIWMCSQIHAYASLLQIYENMYTETNLLSPWLAIHN